MIGHGSIESVDQWHLQLDDTPAIFAVGEAWYQAAGKALELNSSLRPEFLRRLVLSIDKAESARVAEVLLAAFRRELIRLTNDQRLGQETMEGLMILMKSPYSEVVIQSTRQYLSILRERRDAELDALFNKCIDNKGVRRAPTDEEREAPTLRLVEELFQLAHSGPRNWNAPQLLAYFASRRSFLNCFHERQFLFLLSLQQEAIQAKEERFERRSAASAVGAVSGKIEETVIDQLLNLRRPRHYEWGEYCDSALREISNVLLGPEGMRDWRRFASSISATRVRELGFFSERTYNWSLPTFFWQVLNHDVRLASFIASMARGGRITGLGDALATEFHFSSGEDAVALDLATSCELAVFYGILFDDDGRHDAAQRFNDLSLLPERMYLRYAEHELFQTQFEAMLSRVENLCERYIIRISYLVALRDRCMKKYLGQLAIMASGSVRIARLPKAVMNSVQNAMIFWRVTDLALHVLCVLADVPNRKVSNLAAEKLLHLVRLGRRDTGR